MFDTMLNAGFVEYMIPCWLSLSSSGKPIRECLVVVGEKFFDHKRRFGYQAIQKALCGLGGFALVHFQVNPAGSTVDAYK